MQGHFTLNYLSAIQHKSFFSCSAADTHTPTVRVDDADSQRAVLHVALELEQGALTRCHCHIVQLSCKDEQPD